MKDFIEQKVKELLKPLQKRDWNSAEEVDKYFETEICTALTQTAEKARVEELNKQHSLMVLCSEVIGALSCHNEKSAEEYRERLKSLDKEIINPKE